MQCTLESPVGCLKTIRTPQSMRVQHLQKKNSFKIHPSPIWHTSNRKVPKKSGGCYFAVTVLAMADEKHRQVFTGQSKQSSSQISEEQQKKLFEVNTAPLRAWPEVVGMLGEEAKKKIELENLGLTVLITPDSSIFTADYNNKRVRVFVDSTGKVTKTPMIG